MEIQETESSLGSLKLVELAGQSLRNKKKKKAEWGQWTGWSGELQKYAQVFPGVFNAPEPRTYVQGEFRQRLHGNCKKNANVGWELGREKPE